MRHLAGLAVEGVQAAVSALLHGDGHDDDLAPVHGLCSCGRGLDHLLGGGGRPPWGAVEVSPDEAREVVLRPVGGGKVAQRLYGDGREEGSGKAHLSPVDRLLIRSIKWVIKGYVSSSDVVLVMLAGCHWVKERGGQEVRVKECGLRSLGHNNWTGLAR